MQQLTPGVWVAQVLAIALYMLALQPFGFLASSYLFLVVSMRLLGSRRWVANLVISAVSLATIYVIFERAFSVVLPVGRVWQGLLR